MKKLMIMAFAVAVAAVTQAASIDWSCNSYNYAWNSAAPDWAMVTQGTTAYLMFTADYSQSDLVSAFNKDGAFDTAKAAGTGTINDSGTIVDATGTSSYSVSKPVYYALIDGGKLWVSGESEATYDEQTTSFSAMFGYDQVEALWTETQMDASKGYTSGGWYAQGTTPPTPEPTSAMLLLLGVAGLALRRKQK